VSKVRTKVAGKGPMSLAFYWFASGLCRIFARLYWRMSVEGREHVPSSGAFILAPVHRSNIDTIISGTILKRRVRFMGKDSLWKTRAGGWLVTALGAFPVSRGTADREALQRCVEILEGGEPLVVYPEGQRRSGPLVEDIYDGAAYIALRAGVPIVPIGIGGSERAMPKGKRFIYPVKVHAVIGPPIEVKPLEGNRVPRTEVREVSAVLKDELQRLFDIAQVRAGV